MNLKQDHPSKKVDFLVKSLQNWGYDNLSHRNARVTKLWSHDYICSIILVTWQNFVDDIMDRNYDITIFISKYLYFYLVLYITRRTTSGTPPSPPPSLQHFLSYSRKPWKIMMKLFFDEKVSLDTFWNQISHNSEFTVVSTYTQIVYMRKLRHS